MKAIWHSTVFLPFLGALSTIPAFFFDSGIQGGLFFILVGPYCVSGLALILYIRRYFDEVRITCPSIFRDHSTQLAFSSGIEKIFQRSSIIFLAIPFTLTCLAFVALAGAPYSGLALVFAMLYSSVAAFISGIGFAVLAKSLIWFNSIDTLGRTHLHPIPARTVELSQLGKAGGILSLSFSLQLSYGIVCLFILEWSNSNIVEYFFGYFILPLIVLALFSFFVPTQAIRRIIHIEKTRELRRIQSVLSNDCQFTDPKSRDKFDFYQERFMTLLKSPNYALDFSTLNRFFTSLIIPILLFFSQSGFFQSIMDSLSSGR